MAFHAQPRAEMKMATNGDIGDFPRSCGSSGYSGRESVSLTVETVSHPC